MIEEWKEIEGFDGRYSISNLGNIRQNKLQYKGLNGITYNYEEKILEPITWQSRYLRIDLINNKKNKKYRLNTYIHKLVAEYFIGERPEGYVIDHIDGNYLNNRVDNLRYVTQKENQNNPNSKKTGHIWTDEQRKKLSDSLKISMNRPDVNAKLHKKHNMTEEGRNKLRLLMIEKQKQRFSNISD